MSEEVHAVSRRNGVRPKSMERGMISGMDEVEPEVEAAEIEADEKESDEARVMKNKKMLQAPTAEELRVHRITHLPYRAWCPECVAAKGVDDAHPPRVSE